MPPSDNALANTVASSAHHAMDDSHGSHTRAAHLSKLDSALVNHRSHDLMQIASRLGGGEAHNSDSVFVGGTKQRRAR